MKNYNLKLKITRTSHFCLSLHIATQNGLYLHPTDFNRFRGLACSLYGFPPKADLPSGLSAYAEFPRYSQICFSALLRNETFALRSQP